MDGKKLDQDPMQMPSWSIGMACVWIVNRTSEASGRLWEGSLEDALLNHDDSPNDEIQNARTELINALTTGDVQATGLLPNGQRAPIPALEWEDMTFSYDLRNDDGLVQRATSADGSLYTYIRLGRQAVLERWPAEASRTADVITFPACRRRGRRPAYDWSALETAYWREVQLRGTPDPLNEDGWQTQADVERWIVQQREFRQASTSTVRRYARAWLNQVHKS